jgi:hypothetical protein
MIRGGAGAIVTVATLAAVAVLPARAADTASRVTVEFVAPERFTDARESARRSEPETARILAELDRFLQETAGRLLPEDRALRIRVTDLDLAGEFEPWRGPQFAHTRFLREAYPPRIDLTFTLEDGGGRVLVEGKRSLHDPLYLTRSIRVASDRLRYEKSLLEDWLRQELAR